MTEGLLSNATYVGDFWMTTQLPSSVQEIAKGRSVLVEQTAILVAPVPVDKGQSYLTPCKATIIVSTGQNNTPKQTDFHRRNVSK